MEAVNSDTDPLQEDKPFVSGALGPGEIFWRDHFDWLRESGYTLRARYQPGWKPSWPGTKKLYNECEDGIRARHIKTIDAVRSSDGKRVMLKRYNKGDHPDEATIGKLFSSEPLASDVRNHCAPIYDVLQVPDSDNEHVLVMPELRELDDPRFDTIGEIVEFIRQLFEGVQFMHQNHVAHRDITYLNTMMDASTLYLDQYHPFAIEYKLDMSGFARHYTRTQRPVKYYLTDFGLSQKFDPKDGPPLVFLIQAGDKSVPEYKNLSLPRDPFPIDVYCAGNLIRRIFTEGSEFDAKILGLDFLKPLIADMVQEDPSKRPTMDEVVSRFHDIRKTMSSWKLRSQVVRHKENPFLTLYYGVGHWKRRVSYIVRRVPAIPAPSL